MQKCEEIAKNVEFYCNTLKILDKIILAGGGKSVVYLRYIKNYFVLFLCVFIVVFRILFFRL